MEKVKTFLEWLKERENKDELIYVGCRHGGGSWIVIEPVHKIIEKISQIDDMAHSRVEKFNRRAAEELDKLPARMVEYQNRIADAKTKDMRERFEHLLAESQARFVSTLNTKQRTDRELALWTPIERLKVYKVYRHDPVADLPGICIILDGSIPGTLWFKDEKKTI